MLVDSKAVEKLVELRKKDKGLFNKVKQFIKDFFNKVVARYKKIKPTSAEAKLVQQIEGMAEKLQKLFEDALLDATESQRIAGAEKNTAQGGVKYHYAGPKATIKISLFQEAIELDSNGVNSEEIRQKTGWFKGYDGMWRFEIDDSLMKLKSLDKNLTSYTLGDLIVHDKLFGAYPSLKSMKVIVTKLEVGRASYNAKDNKIRIDKALFGNLNDTNVVNKLKKILIHEIQHAIQDIEGFAGGSTPNYWLSAIYNGLDSVPDKMFEDELKITKELLEIQKNKPQFYNDMVEFMDSSLLVPQESSDSDTIEQHDFNAYRDRMFKKYGQMDVFKCISLMYELDEKLKRKAEILHFNTAGEIEAMDVSSRIYMTEEQRKNTRPDIDRTDVVFADENSISMEIVTLDNGKQYVKATEKQVVSGNDPKQWAVQVAKYINKEIRNWNDFDIVTVEGDILTITKDTAYKSGHRNQIHNPDGTYRTMTESEYRVKLNAEVHINELAEVSKKRNKSNVPDRKKHKFAKNGFNYRTAYFEDYDGQYYKITISVGENGKIATVYNVGKLKKDTLPTGKIISSVRGSKANSVSYSYSIPNGTDFVNGNYETPVTYDDSGNVIPLSERFDDSKTDIRFQKKVDSNAKLTDNKNIYNGGAVNGSQNTELLEQGTVSALGRGYDLVWKQSESARKILGCLGIVRERQTQNATGIGRSDSRWLAPNAFQQQIEKGFADGILRTLRGVSLSGRDVIGRELNNKILDLLKKTILKDEDGNVLSLYHWTQNEFDKFKYGDIGFHFGTVEAALDRYEQLKEENAAEGIDTPVGIYKEVYLNVTNPLFMPDIGKWTAYDVAFHLVDIGLISELQYDRLAMTTGFYELSYDNPAINAVRKILSDLGYDGILYYNDAEDTTSISAIALYPEQVVMVTDNGKPVKNSIASETQNGLPRGVLNFQLKSYAVETDGELLAQHLEENSEAVGEILKRSANISMNDRTMRRLIEKRLREYGITSEDRKEASDYISTVFLAAEHPSVQGKDVTEDITKAIREALESTPYDFNPNAEDYREVVDILKGFKGRVYLTADQEAHVREQGYDMRWLRQRLF